MSNISGSNFEFLYSSTNKINIVNNVNIILRDFWEKILLLFYTTLQPLWYVHNPNSLQMGKWPKETIHISNPYNITVSNCLEYAILSSSSPRPRNRKYRCPNQKIPENRPPQTSPQNPHWDTLGTHWFWPFSHWFSHCSWKKLPPWEGKVLEQKQK